MIFLISATTQVFYLGFFVIWQPRKPLLKRYATKKKPTSMVLKNVRYCIFIQRPLVVFWQQLRFFYEIISK
ncbi:hypothetical protein BGC33_13345 [Bathymodiolus thermophilus thioautotrophic gill symbiont]|uniref:Uncharacterized protein n=1 Tax=Bathymodiolus thermophilus thioautotrophic gill symbiont TaxID=2360 RepID=A0A1J5TYX3_9GAMM|nr:hypothetical protein BGC33_13345 [Bathymodiolus thermophilus thioautotrophic gill symbiont]